MSSGFNIEQFKSNTASGFSRDSFFLLQIQTPSFYQNGDTTFLSYLCSSTQLPGMAALTQPVARWGYGPTKQVPYGMTHSDINLSVYSDGNGNALDFFDQWQRSITSFGSTNTKDLHGALFGQVAYPDWYETIVQIVYYSEAGNELVRYVLTDAYPTGMGEIPVSWASAGNIAMITIPLTYRTYQMQRFAIPGIGGSFGNLAGAKGQQLSNELGAVLGGSLASNVSRKLGGGLLGGLAGSLIGKAGTSAMDTLFNSEAISPGFIDMAGSPINFSGALQLLGMATSDINNKVNIVGGIQNVVGGVIKDSVLSLL